MTFSEQLVRLYKLYKKALMEANGATRNMEPVISHQKPGTIAPKDYESIASTMEKRLERLVRLAMVELAAGLPPSGTRGHPVQIERKKVILEERGVPALEVASLYQVNENTVREYRRRGGQNPDDGTPLRTLTPSPEELNKRHTNRKR